MTTRVYLLNPELILGKPGNHSSSCYIEIKSCFESHANEGYALTTSLEKADFILAAIQGFSYGAGLEKLKRHNIYKKHKTKLFVYSPDDNQVPAIRGLYPSISNYYIKKRWALPCHYISNHIRKFNFKPNFSSKDILCSFVGSSRTHSIREKILTISHPEFFLLDSARDLAPDAFWWDSGNKEELFNIFHESTARSLFVICPRGLSPSSIRLYEAMEAGCAPIIVSDDIQLPIGPDWEKFSIKVQEHDVFSIPYIVERMRENAPAMGALARRAWEDYFSPQATAGNLINSCHQLRRRAYAKPMQLSLEEALKPQILKSRLKTRIGDLISNKIQ